MKKALLALIALTIGTVTAGAVDNNTVVISYNGTTASVTIASNISSYISNKSSGSHVKLVQDPLFQGNTSGEITYILTGTSTDGEFYLEGSYKATLELQALTLTNPSGPALNIQDGKRIKISAKGGTVSSLTDGANETYNGCIHCKGHTEFKGKGTLNVTGKSRHAIYSKEYVEVKNLTLNITAAAKDGIHCKEYFLMESGTVKISSPKDDGIQVELDGTTSTGPLTDHEDEDSGNFYMTGGTLTITNVGGKTIKADGTITYSGGTQNFNTSATEQYADISLPSSVLSGSPTETYYDLTGRRLSTLPTRGIVIIKENGHTRKVSMRTAHQ